MYCLILAGAQYQGAKAWKQTKWRDAGRLFFFNVRCFFLMLDVFFIWGLCVWCANIKLYYGQEALIPIIPYNKYLRKIFNKSKGIKLVLL